LALEDQLVLCVHLDDFRAAPADQADLVAGGGAPALGMVGVVVDGNGMGADRAGNDRFRVPLAEELGQDALADLGQGVEAVVLGGFALSVGLGSAAVGGQGVQAGAGARRLRVDGDGRQWVVTSLSGCARCRGYCSIDARRTGH